MSIMNPNPPRTQDDPHSDPEQRSPRHAVTLVAAALFVAVIVVGGTVALVHAHRDGATTSPAPAPAPAVPPSDALEHGGWGPPSLDPLGRRVETPSNPNGLALPQNPAQRQSRGFVSHCPADPSDATGTVFCSTPPYGLMWQRVHAVPMPFSTSDGPTGIAGELPIGFAPTPQGAALAAQQLTARSLAGKSAAVAVTASRMVFDPPELRNKQLDGFAALPEWPPIPLDRIEAYRVAYWAPDYAVIEFASATSQTGAWTTGRVDLVWRDNDWWIKGGPQPGVPAGGTTRSLTGWTVWPHD